jgi:hypothetical protein
MKGESTGDISEAPDYTGGQMPRKSWRVNRQDPRPLKTPTIFFGRAGA